MAEARGVTMRVWTDSASRSPQSSRIENKLRIEKTAAKGLINLRMVPRSPAADTIKAMSGLDLPSTPSEFAVFDRGTVIPLGPDEWLIETEISAVGHMAEVLSNAVQAQHASVVVVTDGYMIFELGGGRARDVLRKGCGIDLHPAVFGEGRCAQTRLARAGVLLLQISDLPAYRIYVDRSMGDYLWSWMSDAALEFRS